MSRVTTLPAPMTTLFPICTPRQKNGTAANPDVVADDDRCCLGLAEGERPVFFLRSKPVSGVGGVEGGIDLHVGSNQSVIANNDAAVIQEGAVHVYFAVVAEVNVVAVIHIKGRSDP